MPDDPRRPGSQASEFEPFNSPVTICPAGHTLEITNPGFGRVDGLRVGICEPCNLIAALTEKVQPAWRPGDTPNILDILARDMDDGERIRDAHFSDDYDPRWTRL